MTTTAGQQGLDPLALRKALGTYPTGVTVITTRSADGRNVGITCNSFASLSLDPPLILWSLRNESTNFVHFDHCDHFAVNILAKSQIGVCQQFARQIEDKFVDVDHHMGIHETALIAGAPTTLECRKSRQIRAGDHTIFIGQVENFSVGDLDADEALVFHRGTFC